MRLLSLKVGAAVVLLDLFARDVAGELLDAVPAAVAAAGAPVGTQLAPSAIPEERLLVIPEQVQLYTPIVNVIGLKDTAYISVKQTHVNYTEKELGIQYYKIRLQVTGYRFRVLGKFKQLNN